MSRSKMFDVKRLPLKIRQRFPNAKTVSDATRRIGIHITATDAQRAKPKDPSACAMARACEREQHVDGAWIGIGTAYLLKGTHLTRYLTPKSVAREIVSFDRHRDFATGDYSLASVYPAIQIGNKTKRPSGTPNKGTRPRGGAALPKHRTLGIRIMTYYLTLRYPTGHHQTLTFPNAGARELIRIVVSPYADVVKQWETDDVFVPRVDRDARSVEPLTAASERM